MSKLISHLILLLFMLFLTSKVFALENKRLKKQSFKRPVRELGIIVSEEGYYPRAFSVFKNEKVKFYITSLVDAPSCFILSEKKMFISVNKGEIAEGEVIFDTPGRYKFYCPAGKVEGYISVLSRKKKKKTRTPASIKRQPKVWMPREHKFKKN